MANWIVDPRQNRLFDPFDAILSDTAKRRLRSSWHFLFRLVILELMPAAELGEHFHQELGRPTKELYSMAGLLLIKEFKNLTHEEAADAYMFDASIQYALNLEPADQSLCDRTIQRYLKLFRDNDLASQIMEQVTVRLVELLELDIRQQRLDSTDVQSDMALFGRTRLMGVAIKNFLTQLKRHDEAEYLTLDATLRERYEPSRAMLFGGWKKDEDWGKTRQQVTQNMHWLVERYAKNPTHNGRSTYPMLCTVFDQQCRVEVDQVVVRSKTGGEIIVNPSDPDATLDGHKGSGYQIQLSETCSEANETQLIVAAVAQQAHESDATAVELVIGQLQQNHLLPTQLLADKIDPAKVRRLKRRQRQETDEFQRTYRKRSGIEATNSILKRMTGLSRLRVRGKEAVFTSMLLKVACFNILRSSKHGQLMRRLAGQFGGLGGVFLALRTTLKAYHRLPSTFPLSNREKSSFALST